MLIYKYATPEQFKVAQDREIQGIKNDIDKAYEVIAEAEAKLARGKKHIKKLHRKVSRKGSRRRRGMRSRKH